MNFQDSRRSFNLIMEAAQNVELGKPHYNHNLMLESDNGKNKSERKFPKPALSDNDKAKVKTKVKKLFESQNPESVVAGAALDYKLHEAVNGAIYLSQEELRSTPATYLTECINEKRGEAFDWIKGVILEGEEKPADESSTDKKPEDELPASEDSQVKPEDVKPEDENEDVASGSKEKPEEKPADVASGIPSVDPDSVTIVDVNDEDDGKKPEDEDKKSEDEAKPDEEEISVIKDRISDLEEVLEKIVAVVEKLVPLEEKEHGVDLDGNGSIGNDKPEDKPAGNTLLGAETPEDKPEDGKNVLTEGDSAKLADEIAKSVANGVKSDDPEFKKLVDSYRATKTIMESATYGIPDAKFKDQASKPAHVLGDAQATKKPVGGEIEDETRENNEKNSVIPIPALGRSAGLAAKNNEGAHGQVNPTTPEGGRPSSSNKNPMALSQAYILLESIRESLANKSKAASKQ